MLIKLPSSTMCLGGCWKTPARMATEIAPAPFVPLIVLLRTMMYWITSSSQTSISIGPGMSGRERSLNEPMLDNATIAVDDADAISVLGIHTSEFAVGNDYF